MKHVLLVDDEPAMREGLQASFSRKGWAVETASGTKEALARFARQKHALVVTDIRMPDGSGMEVMRSVRSIAPSTAVILLTAFGNVPQAVEAIKHGACDYLVKPVSFSELERAAERLLAGTYATAKPAAPIGTSAVFQQLLALAARIAVSDTDVLIEGESGTGKEVLARWIHESSAHAKGPFVAVNCAAVPETLLESELFGHVRGAFTGAIANQPGRLEAAAGGTLLLDEIGEMPLSLQPKLLRVIQEREFCRLGDTNPQRVNVRVIATTNRSLREMVEANRFRLDLFYRLNVLQLVVPPLRERGPADIDQLARLFLERHKPAGSTASLCSGFLQRLVAHDWPGNVRELENCIRRALVLSTSDCITADMPQKPMLPALKQAAIEPGATLEQMEKALFIRTLEATGGNRSRTADLLGVSLRTVRNKIRQYGLPARRMNGSY